MVNFDTINKEVIESSDELLPAYEELKKFCDVQSEDLLGEVLLKMYKKEIKIAKRFYTNGRNLFNELVEKKDKLDARYTIPYLLGITDHIATAKEKIKPQYIQVKAGASGGIDIDSDIEAEGRDQLFDYLVEKYGTKRVAHIGTFSKLGMSSAAKDLLRIYEADFKKSNEFTKNLDTELTWEENIRKFKATNPMIYKFYKQYQSVLDLVPQFLTKVRGMGVHAGGVAILNDDIHNLIPVERINGQVVTAFPESSTEQTLDEIGVVKYDMLSISILNVMKNTLRMLEESGETILEIEEDGVRKIVPESYVNNFLDKF